MYRSWSAYVAKRLRLRLCRRREVHPRCSRRGCVDRSGDGVIGSRLIVGTRSHLVGHVARAVEEGTCVGGGVCVRCRALPCAAGLRGCRTRADITHPIECDVCHIRWTDSAPRRNVVEPLLCGSGDRATVQPNRVDHSRRSEDAAVVPNRHHRKGLHRFVPAWTVPPIRRHRPGRHSREDMTVVPNRYHRGTRSIRASRSATGGRGGNSDLG